jgi:recombination associated protein RdgC
MFFKNAQIYRLPTKWEYAVEQLSAALAPHVFTPAGSNELMRQGWIAPRGNGVPLVHAVHGQWLLRLQTEKKLLPAAVINQAAKARAAEMEEAQGFAPRQESHEGTERAHR